MRLSAGFEGIGTTLWPGLRGVLAHGRRVSWERASLVAGSLRAQRREASDNPALRIRSSNRNVISAIIAFYELHLIILRSRSACWHMSSRSPRNAFRARRPRLAADVSHASSGILGSRDAAAAGGGAGADQGFVHDRADGARAATALGAAAETAKNCRGRVRRGRVHDAPHLMVAQHVAGTDDHRKPGAPAALNGGLRRNLGQRLDHVVDYRLDQNLVISFAHHPDHRFGAGRAHDQAAAAAELFFGAGDGRTHAGIL